LVLSGMVSELVPSGLCEGSVNSGIGILKGCFVDSNPV
jgi:hypothetical protein